jgi:flagellar protein FliS
MLLDRAVGELAAAEGELQVGNRLEAAPHLRRAQDIVNELRTSLDLSVGQIATNLDDLYGYAYRELVEASLDGKVQRVIDVAGILEPVREAWTQACCGLVPSQV